MAIRNFLTKETKLGGGELFQIDVHDLPMPTAYAEWTIFSMQNTEKNVKAAKEQSFTMPSASSSGSK